MGSSSLVQEQPSSDLIFITQTGPRARKDQQRSVRKHVMKKIGLSRRKDKIHERPIVTQIVLDVPDAFDYSIPHDKTEWLEDHDEVLAAVLHEDLLKSSTENSTGIISLRSPANEESAGTWTLSTLDRQLHGQRTETGSAIFIPPKLEKFWTGRMDPFVNYPIKMNHRTLQLMDHIFDERYGNTPPYRDAWLPVSLESAASFHQVLANAALNLASLQSKDSVPEQRESLYHHNTALRLVAMDLQDPKKSTSDGVLTSITAFACYSHVIGDQARWHMHMAAVKGIIERRGGLRTLDSNPLLRMVMFWVDMGGSTTEDVQPYFPPPSGMLPERGLDYVKSPLAQQIAYSWRSNFEDHYEIMDILDDIRSYSHFLMEEAERTKGAIYSDGAAAAYGILPLLYRIVNLSSHLVSFAQQRLDIVRLGCILFFSEVRRLFGIMGIMPAHQTKKLRQILEQHKDDWGSLETLKAWVLAMACMESNGEQRQWFFAQLQNSKERLGIATWDDMESKFKDILWYSEAHSVVFSEVVCGIEYLTPAVGLRHGSRFGGYRPLAIGTKVT